MVENLSKAVKEYVGRFKMKTLRKVAVVAISMLSATLFAAEASAQAAKPAEARNVVLVHGAWADGSSWAEVISRLQAAGLHVTAVQNPLTTLAESVAATRRALALQDGPTVLVAHSWGGTVISEAGIDPKVTALVYVAARAPDAGEDFVGLSGKFPTMPVRAGVQERDGFTNLSEEAFLKYFANGVPHKRAEVLYAEQEPTAASLFGERTTVAAWRSKPSCLATSVVFDAPTARRPRLACLRSCEELVDERGLANAGLAGDEHDSAERTLQRRLQGRELASTTDERGPPGAGRVSAIRMRRVVACELGDEAIAASDDGLDDPFAQDLPQIVHVRPQQALAHRDPAPHGFDDLVVRDQAVRMQHEVTQNRERFAAEAQLLAISPKTLVTEIELKWWE